MMTSHACFDNFCYAITFTDKLRKEINKVKYFCECFKTTNHCTKSIAGKRLTRYHYGTYFIQVVNKYIDQGVAELVPGVLFVDEVIFFMAVAYSQVSKTRDFQALQLFEQKRTLRMFLFILAPASKLAEWAKGGVSDHFISRQITPCRSLQKIVILNPTTAHHTCN